MNMYNMYSMCDIFMHENTFVTAVYCVTSLLHASLSIYTVNQFNYKLCSLYSLYFAYLYIPLQVSGDYMFVKQFKIKVFQHVLVCIHIMSVCFSFSLH